MIVASLPVVVGLALLAVALFLPGDAIALRMTGAAPGSARIGLTIFRICLGLEGLLVVAWALSRREWLGGPARPRIAPPERPAAKIPWPALLSLLAIGAALRTIGLDRGLWVDEVATVTAYLRLRPWQVLYTYYTPNQHLFYSLAGSVSVWAFGESAWSARLPAALFGVAGLLALYDLGRAVTSEREALLATAFMTVSYHHVWFSQDARGYTSMIFWSTLGTGLFLRALTRDRTAHWVGWIACMVLAIASVQVAVWVFLGQVAAYVLTRRRPEGQGTGDRGLTRRVLLGALLVGLLTVHVHSLVLPRIIGFLVTAPRAGLGSGITSPLQFVALFREGLQAGFLGMGLLGVLLLMAAGWLSYWRQARLVALILVLPPMLGVAAIVLFRYGAYPRAFLYVLPMALLVAVRGATTCGHGVARRLFPAGLWRERALAHLGHVLAGIMLVLSAAALPLNYRYPKQDYVGALDFVNERKAPGDRISAAGMAAGIYRNYYGPGLDFPATPDELGALGGPGHTVWVLYSFPRDMRLRFPELYDYIRSHGRIVATFPGTVGDGTIYVTRIDGR